MQIKLVIVFIIFSIWFYTISMWIFCDSVYVYGLQEVPENKRRLSVYKGIVISKQNAGIHTTFRVRRIIAGIGVEIVFPL